MTSRYALLISLVFLLGGQAVPAQDKESKEALKELKGLPMEVAKEMGFATKQELDSSTLGLPFKVYMLQLDDVGKFKKGDDANKILRDVKELVYPVYAGATLRSSVSLRQAGAVWKHAAIGSGEARLIEPERKKQAAKSGKKENEYFLVKVPAMYMGFLGYFDKGKLYLIPIHQHRDLKLALYQPLPAETVLLALAPLAPKYKLK